MSDHKDKIRGIINAHAAELKADIECEYWEAAEKCGSPIEQIMLARLVTLSVGYGQSPPSNRISFEKQEKLGLWPFELVILPQAGLGKYRVDFLLALGIPKPLAGGLVVKHFIIECDGHDFHEKTKQQAASDKARDRFLQSLGYPVFRYTGSEVFANKEELLRDIEKAMWLAIKEVLEA